MSTSLAEKLYTEEEYLALERASDHKSEFINGRIYAMAGASAAHNLIAGNIYAEFHNQFKGRPCVGYTSDLRIRVSETGMYTYPDVSALCGNPQFLDDKQDTLLNPTIVVEVLSPSTEAYDRGEKFEHYRALTSLQEILLVSQDHVHVDHFVLQDDRWAVAEYSELTDVVILESVGVRLKLQDLYDKVELPPRRKAPRRRGSG